MSSTSRVVVNGAIIQRGISGSARATQQITEALSELPGLSVSTVLPPWRSRTSSALANASRDAWWDCRGASRAARRPDLFVSPCNVGIAPRGSMHVLVIYDVMIFENPELFDKKFVKYFEMLVPASMRRADRVLTLSEHSREYLERISPASDIRVMTLPGRRQIGPATQPSSLPTVLMVGSTEPHKNHVSGIEAVAELRARSQHDVRLRLVGPPGRDESRVQLALDAFDSTRAWSSREIDLTDAEIDHAYETSWLLLQPSLNEGYGLPLVEAAQRGLPVVHSGRGAMDSILPLGNARGVDSSALVEAMQPLLQPSQWSSRSLALTEFSQVFDWSRFPDHISHLLEGLIP